VRARHKRWAAPFLAEHPELVKESLPLDNPFYAQSPLYLEIGAGKGDFVIQMASRGGHWLALERDVSISGLLAKKVLASALPNVILMRVDFDEVAPTLKEGAFAGVYLNFSDPWPKKKPLETSFDLRATFKSHDEIAHERWGNLRQNRQRFFVRFHPRRSP
jgi:tRNA (guanine-N7-)-methyltransferase